MYFKLSTSQITVKKGTIYSVLMKSLRKKYDDLR